MPPTWQADLKKALAGTSADRAAVVGAAVKPVKVEDKTAATSSDAEVNPKNLVAYDPADPVVAYDDALNSKKGRSANAAFTKSRGKQSFLVIGPKALEKKDFFWIRVLLSHELDHVRQHGSGSNLHGNESEVDAWTTSFIRDFHRTYLIRERGSTCYVDDYQTFSQLTAYYEQADVGKTVKDDVKRRLQSYYEKTVKPHPVHTAVFRWWLYRTMKGKTPALAKDLNAALNLVDPALPANDVRQFPCDVAKSAKYPAPPEVAR